MSGPTNYDSQGLEMFTEQRPAIVQLADLMDYINEMRDIFNETEKTMVEIKLMKYLTNIKEYGVIGDGVTDDTVAFQKAIDSKKPLKVPQGVYKITDTLKIYENTKIIGDYGSTNNIVKAKTKITFNTTSQKNVFEWHESVNASEYVYGVHIEGLSFIASNGLSIFDLKSCADFHAVNINSFGYFDHAVIVDNFIDSKFSNCSFQGITISPVKVVKTIEFSTTTTFEKCYFAQSNVGVKVEDNSINSLVFDDCIFESLNAVIDQHRGNNVMMYKCYVERVPISDTENDSAFILGVNGTSLNDFGTFLWDGGIIQGHIGNNFSYPSNANLVHVNMMRDVTFNDVSISRFMYLIKHTDNFEKITFSNVAVANVSYYGKKLDWSKINVIGGNFQQVYLDGESVPTKSSIIVPEIMVMPSDKTQLSPYKIVGDVKNRQLKYVDGYGLQRKMGFLNAGSSDKLFPNARLHSGDILFNDEIVSKGYPIGYVSMRFSRDTSANNYTAVTTAGSPIVTNSISGNQYFDFKIGDQVTVSEGMPSNGFQYTIIDKANDGSSITLNYEAVSNQTNVHIQLPTHDLQAFGQIGFRQYGAPPIGVFTPNKIGEELLDNVNQDWYKSTGLTANDWKKIT